MRLESIMGNLCKPELPPPYHGNKIPPATGGNNSGECQQGPGIYYRALNAALLAFSKSADMESQDAPVVNRKTTIQSLSTVVYGRPINWGCMVAYVHTARELNPEWLVLPESSAVHFLEREVVQQ